MPVHLDVAVGDELARRVAREGEARREERVVEAPLEEHEEVLAGVPLDPLRAREHESELGLEETIDPLQLLLLAKAKTIFGDFGSARRVLAGG